MVDTAGPETALDDLETAAFAEDHCGKRNPDVLELDLAVSVGRVIVAEDTEGALDSDAWRVVRDEDNGLLLVGAGVVGIGLAHDDVDLAARVWSTRGPPLGAIEDV